MIDKLKRAAIWVPAKLYELAVRLRIAAYETGYLKPKRLSTTVIAVGNITLGGTGKTPLVEYLARYLLEEGQRVVILTRGYARKSRGQRVLSGGASSSKTDLPANLEYGDEPLMMSRALPGIPIVINANRHQAGLFAERELGAEVLLLDDAYQHLQLHRDLNILVIDATNPFGGFEMVPLGQLREPLYALRRADAVVITRAHRPFDQAQTLGLIRDFCGEKVPVMYVYSSIARLRHLETGELYGVAEFAGWNACLLCGIGNPRAFSEDVLQAGINIISEHFFPDHHLFTQEDVDRVLVAARQAGADLILTTEKDAVRLHGLTFGEVPVYTAALHLQSEDEVRLKSLVLRTLYRR